MGWFDWFRKPKPEPVSDEEAFVRDIEARARAIARRAEVTRDPKVPLGLLVKTAQSEVTAFLGNVFLDIRALDPATRERMIEQHVAQWGQPIRELTWEEARANLAVALRGPLVDAPLMVPAAREVAPCLRAHVVVDRETSLVLVHAGQLTQWGVSLDEALAGGIQRLAQAPRTVALHDEARRIWRVATDDSYEAARLLVPGFLAEFIARVPGRPIAIVPTRNLAFIAGDADPDVVVHLCELAEREFASSPRRISAAVYAHDEAGAMVRYLPDGDDLAARRVRTAHVRTEGTWYNEQKAELEARFQATGAEVFVASFSGLEHPQHGSRSFCTWAPGVDALLPKTDLVALGATAEDIVLVPWDEVQRVAGPKLVREPDYFPTRWRTMGTLNAAELDTLRAAEFKLPR